MDFSRKYKKIVRVTLLVVGMVSIATAGLSIAILYETAVAGQRERLTDTARTLAEFVRAVARFDAAYGANDFDGNPRAATVTQIVEAHRHTGGFGRTGEFLMAERSGDTLRILLAPRHQTVPLHVPVDAPFAEPMRRALRGESGTMLGSDYRGTEVLVAFEGIPELNLGVVTKIDLAEIRAPFVRAGIASVLLTLVLILAAVRLFQSMTRPLVQRLEKSERHYRTLFEISPHGVLVIDSRDHHLVDFNTRAHEQLGLSRDAFAAACARKSGAEGLSLYSCIENLATGTVTSFHREVVGGDGKARHIHVDATPLERDEQELVYAICRDVTEQARTEAELERYRNRLEELIDRRTTELTETNRRLQQEMGERVAAEDELRLAGIVYANTSEGIFVTDSGGSILSVNPAFTRITGYASEEAVGQNPRILKSDRQGPHFYREMWRQLLGNGRWEGEMWNRRKNGEAYLQSVAITRIDDPEGRVKNYVAVFNDITELHDKEVHIRHQTYHDALTGLPNKMLFRDRLEQAIAHSHRSGAVGAVLLLDLDRFKLINETLGHDMGDALLQHVAALLSHSLREDDTVSRFGGDEFAILLPDLTSGMGAETVAKHVAELLARPCPIGDHELTTTASVGISLFPTDGADAETLLKNADTAMYRAKDSGRNNYQFYTADMNARAFERLALESDLRKAIERQELTVFFQPRMELLSGTIVGMEALVRWQHPKLGLVSPGRFIPVAEETGLIVAIGEEVLRLACEQTRRWVEEGFDLRVSVNISPRQVARAEFVATIDAALERASLDGKHLEVELTETLVMQQPETTIAYLRELKRRGIRVAVDDFGTGYSSLNYLKRLPIDVLKIDQSFVRDITTDPDDAAIAETVIALGHSLRLEVVAEGVEREEQLAFLLQRDCDSIQGFFISPPLPAEEFEALIRSGKYPVSSLDGRRELA